MQRSRAPVSRVSPHGGIGAADPPVRRVGRCGTTWSTYVSGYIAAPSAGANRRWGRATGVHPNRFGAGDRQLPGPSSAPAHQGTCGLNLDEHMAGCRAAARSNHWRRRTAARGSAREQHVRRRGARWGKQVSGWRLMMGVGVKPIWFFDASFPARPMVGVAAKRIGVALMPDEGVFEDRADETRRAASQALKARARAAAAGWASHGARMRSSCAEGGDAGQSHVSGGCAARSSLCGFVQLGLWGPRTCSPADL